MTSRVWCGGVAGGGIPTGLAVPTYSDTMEDSIEDAWFTTWVAADCTCAAVDWYAPPRDWLPEKLGMRNTSG
jgi:hypothetical protein